LFTTVFKAECNNGIPLNIKGNQSNRPENKKEKRKLGHRQ
jgi:hypothetical protein